MSDDRGSYKPLAEAEEHEVLGSERPHDSRTFPRRKWPSGLCLWLTTVSLSALIALFGFVYFSHDTPSEHETSELAASHLQLLSSRLDAHKIVYSNTTSAYVVGEHHPVSGEFPVDYEWIDPDSRAPFNEIMMTNGMNNNAMARMPAGSPYDMLVVARGRNDRYIDQTEGIIYVNLTLVGFFVNYDAKSGAWIRAGPEPYILDIPIWRQFPRPCLNLVNGGPADPRLIWSDAGEPLAIIGTSSRVTGACKAVGLADLRTVWPGLKHHLEDIGYGDIPIRFKQFTEVGKVGDVQPYEKNWAAFFAGPKPAVSLEKAASSSGRWLKSEFQRGPSIWPYFATEIENRSIVEVNERLDTSERSQDSYVLSEPVDLTIPSHTNASIEATSRCIFDSLPSDWNLTKLHLATPFYRVTFCPRGTCVPSRQNTLLLGLIHYKQTRRSYRRMFVTMKVDAPFEIVSVSPPLHFGKPPKRRVSGFASHASCLESVTPSVSRLVTKNYLIGSSEMDDGVVFSVSMTFLPTKKMLSRGESPFVSSNEPAGGWLAHGWLDDTIVVGAGLRDAAYDAVHLPVATALQGHTLCL